MFVHIILMFGFVESYFLYNQPAPGGAWLPTRRDESAAGMHEAISAMIKSRFESPFRSLVPPVLCEAVSSMIDQARIYHHMMHISSFPPKNARYACRNTAGYSRILPADRRMVVLGAGLLFDTWAQGVGLFL